jgi:hypothetical protein
MVESLSLTLGSDDNRSDSTPWAEPRLIRAAGYESFAERYAGCTFAQGLYRLHDALSGPRSMRLVLEAFPQLADRAVPFAYDWLGRQFALDSARTEAGQSLILLIEPGTGQALEIPLTFVAFHEQLDELREPALAGTFFAEWSAANPDSLPLQRSECVGYRIPLFLGGRDALENLEVIDLEVYWTLTAQLWFQAGRMDTATAIEAVTRDKKH